MLLLSARSSTAAAMAADCVIRAILPGAATTGATLALRPAAGTITPPLPGPSTRISQGRAASRMALRASSTWLSLSVSRSRGPTMTARVPRAPSLAMICGTSGSAAQTIARSGAISISSMWRCLPMPNRERFCAATEATAPANPPAARLRSTTSA